MIIYDSYYYWGPTHVSKYVLYELARSATCLSFDLAEIPGEAQPRAAQAGANKCDKCVICALSVCRAAPYFPVVPSPADTPLRLALSYFIYCSSGGTSAHCSVTLFLWSFCGCETGAFIVSLPFHCLLSWMLPLFYLLIGLGLRCLGGGCLSVPGDPFISVVAHSHWYPIFL